MKMSDKLWLIWKEPKERRRYIIGELTYDNNIYSFKYIDPELNNAKEKGLDYFPGFNDTEKEYKSETGMFANIESRLPNTSRPEYLAILNTYDLDTDASKIEILKKTKGRLITDNFEFVPVFDKNKIEFEIAGTRHSKDIKKYRKVFEINDNLILKREPENPYDEYAVKVECKKNGKLYMLGYVPRFYSRELSKMLEENIKYSAQIKYLNFETSLRDEDITVDVKLILQT